MQIMQTYVGDYGGSYLGQHLTSADFNGDGFDDLFMVQYHDATTVPTKILGYFGSSAMDTIPDMIRSEQFSLQIVGCYLLSAGDINGDGYDDLLDIENVQNTTSQDYLRFYYGGASPDLVPDHEILLNVDGQGHPEYIPYQCIGDINHDGCDDLGVVMYNGNYVGLGILLGGAFQLITIVAPDSNRYANTISGTGDVNGDGYDDFVIGRSFAVPVNVPVSTHRYIYFGHNGYIDLTDYIQIPDFNLAFWMPWSGAYGIGDFNGDGNDDFVTDYIPDVNTYHQIIKLGSPTLPTSQEFTIDNGYWGMMMNYRYKGVAYGDFNGDGYSDIVGANYEDMINAGKAGIWLGRANPNGLYDLHISPPQTSFIHQFGWAVCTGDFNGDGYCDFAISAPNSQSGDAWYPGYVYVYAGNAQLADTTVGNDDDTTLPILPSVKLTIYPNPVSSRNIKLNYVIAGELPKDSASSSIAIYNVKGQVVSNPKLTSFNLQKASGQLPAIKLKPGMYIAALMINNSRTAITKFTIK